MDRRAGKVGLVITRARIGYRGTRASCFSCCKSCKEPMCASSSLHEKGECNSSTQKLWKAACEFENPWHGQLKIEGNANDRSEIPLCHRRRG